MAPFSIYCTRIGVSEVAVTSALARAIGHFAQTAGDHNTAIPALTLHRRQAPTEPLHCIYHLGLGVVAQGGKQVLLGGTTIHFGPGQSMLTTIDLPVVSHVTQATGGEPFLGMMLTLDARSILQIASENLDAGSAAGLLGYESASQFSRDYSRLSGAPPQRDIKRMRLV